LGRNLKSRQTNSILLTLSTVVDPYCAAMVRDITHSCGRQGYRTLLGDLNYNPALEATYLRDLHSGYVDGLMALPLPASKNTRLFCELVNVGFPLVLIDNDIPAAKANCVKYDDVAAAEMAVDYLVDKGHRNIAFGGWRMEYQTVQGRLRGYRQALKRRGLAVREEFLMEAPPQFSDWDLASQAKKIFGRKNHPTAIVAENEIVALGWIHAVRQLGKCVPEDVAIVAFGDTAVSPMVPMPLTTVALPLTEAAETATELLVELMQASGQQKKPPRKVILPSKLVVRESA
jgi:DNA-binding LacI/PurR family transcriptional regulator